MTVPATAPWPRIPYGEMSFRRIRTNGWLYVDKTRFLRPLEEERYAFFIRPRRFGKSCWLSLLECYYGRHWAHEFEDLFGGTDIGRAPTAERGRYVVVRFDSSAFNDKLETLEERFEGYCHTRLRTALERHPDLFPEAALQRILTPPAIDGKLTELFAYAGEHGIPLYMLIDEYDNFANTVLAHRGREAYESFTHGGGFTARCGEAVAETGGFFNRDVLLPYSSGMGGIAFVPPNASSGQLPLNSLWIGITISVRIFSGEQILTNGSTKNQLFFPVRSTHLLSDFLPPLPT